MARELGGFGTMIPPAFLWYYQYGYKERWNNPDNNDPSMKRSFDEYVNEAIDKGWWDPSYSQAYREVEPRVLFEAGGNMLRRQRGGQKLLLETAVAQAQDDRVGRLPHQHHRPVLRLHPAGGPALREARQLACRRCTT